MSYGGLGSGLRRNDGFLEVPSGVEMHWRGFQAGIALRPAQMLGFVNEADGSAPATHGF